MGVLDQFCRFCTQRLDHSEHRNIFEAENSRLLELALRCIPLPMAASDRYPNFTCHPCAYKLNDVAAFQLNGLAAVNFFDEFLQGNDENSSMSAEHCDEVIIKNEIFEETEMDFVEEFTLKLETRSEHEIEVLDLVQDKAELILKQEPPYQLKKCSVKLTRCENFSPGTSTPVKREENVTSGVDEESFSESQCIAKTNSQQINAVGSSKLPFFCDLCHKTFKSKWDFNRHLLVHTDEKPFKCQYCTKNFKTKGTMNRHIRTHTGEKPFECEYCNKCFSQRPNLVIHIRIHTGEKPFECEYCKKRFNTRRTLKGHVKTHTVDKPFQCKYCKKSFAPEETLVDHVRIHSGEKLFECGYCSKCFNRKLNLVNHIRIHTGEKPFECESCYKKFNEKQNLVTHTITHTGEKPFECEYCTKSFITKGTLARQQNPHWWKNHLKVDIVGKASL